MIAKGENQTSQYEARKAEPDKKLTEKLKEEASKTQKTK